MTKNTENDWATVRLKHRPREPYLWRLCIKLIAPIISVGRDRLGWRRFANSTRFHFRCSFTWFFPVSWSSNSLSQWRLYLCLGDSLCRRAPTAPGGRTLCNLLNSTKGYWVLTMRLVPPMRYGPAVGVSVSRIFVSPIPSFLFVLIFLLLFNDNCPHSSPATLPCPTHPPPPTVNLPPTHCPYPWSFILVPRLDPSPSFPCHAPPPSGHCQFALYFMSVVLFCSLVCFLD